MKSIAYSQESRPQTSAGIQVVLESILPWADYWFSADQFPSYDYFRFTTEALTSPYNHSSSSPDEPHS